MTRRSSCSRQVIGMSSNLNAVYEELRRLQQSGVDRIYITEQTSNLLQSAKSVPNPLPEALTTKLPVIELSQQTDSAERVTLAAAAAATTPRRVRQPTPASFKPIPSEAPVFQLPDGSAVSRLQWLHETVHSCNTCQEHLTDNGQIVFGEGPVDADILICGDAPGPDEARTGRPFMDKSGELLTKIIHAMGLKRESIYLTSALKWRPEHATPYASRPPNSDELNFCLPYLRAQLEIIQPKVVIALGRAVVSALFGAEDAKQFGALRGSWKTFEGFPVMVTFNPSYLLQNDTLKTKRLAWEDLLQVMQRLDLPINPKQRAFFLPKK